MAIDNIDYYSRQTQREQYDQELINYFGGCEVFFDELSALVKARAMDKAMTDEWGYGTEYGIAFIELDHEFPTKED